jgi:hypothetical protein
MGCTAVAEKYTGNQRLVNAMIRAPGIVIIMEP